MTIEADFMFEGELTVMYKEAPVLARVSVSGVCSGYIDTTLETTAELDDYEIESVDALIYDTGEVVSLEWEDISPAGRNKVEEYIQSSLSDEAFEYGGRGYDGYDYL